MKNKDLKNLIVKYGYLAAFVTVAALGFIVYSNTFHSPFIFDDFVYVAGNPKLRSLSSLWPPTESRYIGFVSFALDYRIHGLEVFGYHIVNVLIHVVNAFLVFMILASTFKTPALSAINIKKETALAFAFLASVIFTVHPLQTQAVSYITQRFASLATLFYLASLFLYIRWRLSGKNVLSAVFILSIAFAFMAQKTKEISFTLPAVIALYEFSFFKGRPGLIKRILPLVPFMAALLIVPLSIFGPDIGIVAKTPGVGENIRELHVLEIKTLPWHIYLFTQFRVVVTYLRLLVLPVNQSLYHDYPLYQSFFDPSVLISFVFLAAIFIFACYLLARSRKSGSPAPLLASFGILWFFITLSVESSVIPIKDVIFEHRLYLPLFGALMVFASAVVHFGEYAVRKGYLKLSIPALLLIVAAVAAVPLSAAAYARNMAWKDELTIWKDVVAKNPFDEFAHTNLAHSYKKAGMIGQALSHYEKAVELNPRSDYVHYNLGLVYLENGRVAEAIAEQKKALEIDPDSQKAHLSLGMAYLGNGLVDSAIEEYMTAVRLNPYDEKAHNNLGNAYLKKGMFQEAINELEAALKINPQNPAFYLNIGLAYESSGQSDMAIRYYRMFIERSPVEYQAQVTAVSSKLEKLQAGR